MRWKLILIGAMIAAAASGLGAALTLFAFAGGGTKVTSQTVERVLGTSESFPDVVATVNGQPISGRTLAYNVEIAKMNAGVPAESKASPALVREALQHLIGEELLVQAARARGLWPSQDEVVAAATELERQIKSAPAAERQADEEGYALQGFTLDDIDSAPALLEVQARVIALARMQTEIEKGLPPDQLHDLNAHRAAIDQFIENLKSQSDIRVFIALPPE